MAEGHAVDGTPISTFARESGYEPGLPDLAGEDLSLSRQLGLTAGTRTPKGRDYPLFLTIDGDNGPFVTPRFSREKYYANIAGLGQLLYKPDADGRPQTFVLSRTIPVAAGEETHTITARYASGFRVGQDPNAIWLGYVAPVLLLIDPFWVVQGTSTRVYL